MIEQKKCKATFFNTKVATYLIIPTTKFKAWRDTNVIFMSHGECCKLNIDQKDGKNNDQSTIQTIPYEMLRLANECFVQNQRDTSIQSLDSNY